MVIRSETESTDNGMQGNTEADSQEDTLLDSRSDSYNSGILKNLNLKMPAVGEIRSAEEIFEERINEIDKELNRFDPTINTAAKNIKVIESHSLSEDQSVYTQTSRAQQHIFSSPLIGTPRPTMDENTVHKIQRVATWKRLNRTEMGIDVDMEDFVGEKRRGEISDDQSELLKKRKVS